MENEGHRQLSSGNAPAAIHAYADASTYYSKAAEEASAARKSADELTQLRQGAIDARESMRTEKSAAEKLSRKAKTSQPYGEALANERKGEEYLKGTNADSIRKATDAFHDAAMRYHSIGEFLASKPVKQPEVKEPKQQVASRNQTEVPRHENTPTVIPPEAKDTSTGRPIVAAASKPVSPKEDEAAKEREQRDLAETAIQNIIARYRTSLEAGNVKSLTSLLHFTNTEQEQWSTFYSIARKVRARVDVVKKNIDVQDQSATVTLSVSISYFNTSRNIDDQNNLVLNLRLESANGEWSLVSRN
jgi:hypothetical protein